MSLSSSTLASIIIAGTAITGSAAAVSFNHNSEPETNNTLQVSDEQQILPDGTVQTIPPTSVPLPTPSADPTTDPITPPIVPTLPPTYGNGDDDDDEDWNDDGDDWQDDDGQYEDRHHEDYDDDDSEEWDD